MVNTPCFAALSMYEWRKSQCLQAKQREGLRYCKPNPRDNPAITQTFRKELRSHFLAWFLCATARFIWKWLYAIAIGSPDVIQYFLSKLRLCVKLLLKRWESWTSLDPLQVPFRFGALIVMLTESGSKNMLTPSGFGTKSNRKQWEHTMQTMKNN